MIKSIIFSSTAKDSYKSFLGNAVSSFCGFLIITILTRLSSSNKISLDEIGLFLTALTFTQLVADLFELGINPASINFLTKNKEKYFQAILVLKFSIAIVISTLTFLFSSLIANLIFHSSAMTPFVQISALGIGLLTLLNWFQTVFQTEKKFGWASVVISSTNVFRLIGVMVLVLLGVSGGSNYYFIFHFCLIFSILLFFSKFGFNFLNYKSNFSQFTNVLKFGLPVGLGFGLSAIYTRLDQIFIFSLAGAQEAATYGLASRLIIIIIFAVTAFNSAVAIRFVSLEEQNFLSYFKKTYLASFGLVFLLLINILIAPILVPLLFGIKFQNSVLPYQILTLGIIFFCLSLPLYDVILYRYNKQFFSFWSAITSLILTLILLQLFIPKFGSTGAAAAMSLVYFSQLFLCLIYYLKIKST